MDVIYGLEKIKKPFTRTVVTIGNFDGVHVGHQHMLQQLDKASQQHLAESVLITFSPHPLNVLRPAQKLMLIHTLPQKIAVLAALNLVRTIVVIDFTPEFSKRSPEVFIDDVICRMFRPVQLVVGFNFNFGHGGKGNAETLKTLGQKNNFSVQVVPPYEMNGEIVSSTLIRHLLSQGNVRWASQKLNRIYTVEGTVVTGDQRGRKIGFPTANISVKGDFFLALGVYAVEVDLDGQIYPGVANVGTRPTFIDGLDPSVVLEVHLFNFDRSIYGKDVAVRFIDRIRDERRFPNVEALTAQIAKDIAQARKILYRS